MPSTPTLSELRGLVQLACDSTIGVTDLVEQMHGTILTLPLPLGRTGRQPNAGVARLVYGSVRGTTRLVNWTVKTATAPWHRADPELATRERGALVAALNGVAGDHLARTDNPLATTMRLRRGPEPVLRSRGQSRQWLLLVHGMCMDDSQWLRNGHDHGAALARDLAYTPLYLRYNSGLGLQENARQLSRQLACFFAEHGQVDDTLTVLAFSLGGLLMRSTIAEAGHSSHQWLAQLKKIVFLGTPHNGAPLATGGQRLDQALMISPYSAAFARLGLARSLGLQELHEGLGPELQGLPASVAAFALAGSLSDAPCKARDGLLGDGLVTVRSALAQARGTGEERPASQLTGQVIRGVGHLALLESPAVYEQLVSWLKPSS